MEKNPDKETLTQGEPVEMTKTTISIPAAMHKEIRFAALEMDIQQQDIYVEAAREWLARYRAKQREKTQAVVKAIANEAVAKHSEPAQQE